MNLLFPAMLAGLAGLSVPVILHLIARSRFPVWDFPTIRLLRYEKRDNVFARKLVDPWQLLLRLLLIALLVFAMSRLFLPSMSEELAPRNLIVVLDASASMEMAAQSSSEEDSTTTLEVAKRIAHRLLSEIALPSRCALVTVGDDIDVVPMGPTPDAALEELPSIKTSGGTGPGLVRAVAQSCEMLRGRREVRSQIVVLTDLRSSAFETRNQRDLQEIAEGEADLGEALEIIVVDVGASDAENVAIIDAYLRGGQARVLDDAHVIARVRNLGAQPKPANITLTVAGKQEPAFRKLMLQPEEEVVVDLTSLVNRSVRSFAAVMLQDSDAVMHDNVYSVPLVGAPHRNVLIVNGAADAAQADTFAAFGVLGGTDEFVEEAIDGARIIQYVLNPARELGRRGGTSIEPKVVTPDTLPAETLSIYDIIVLYDLNSLPGEFAKDIDTFVRQGRSVLIFCSTYTNPVEFNENIANPKGPHGALAPAQIGTERKFDPNIGMRPSNGRKAPGAADLTFSPGLWLAPFREQRQGGISVVRLARAREIRGIKEGANVLLQGTGGEILAIEAKHGQGNVILFGFGVELSRGNIAMTKVFPQLMWRLVDYVTGKLRSKPSDSLIASEPSALDAGEPAFGAVEELEFISDRGSARPVPMRRPIGAEETVDVPLYDDEGAEGAPAHEAPAGKGAIEPRTLQITPQKTVMLEGLPVGHYRLRKKIGGSGSARPIAVNPDPRESEMTRVDKEDMHDVFTADTQILKPEETTGIAPTGLEAWQWVVALLMVAYLAEAISAYVIGVIRSKKLEAEEAL